LADKEHAPTPEQTFDNLGISLVDRPLGAEGPTPSGSYRLREETLSSFIGKRKARLVGSSVITLFLMLALISLYTIGAFSSLRLPPALDSPYVMTLLAVLVLYFAVQTYTDAVRFLAFYKRFVRPGLREMLEVDGESLYRGEKLFRGRKTVIMKVDIADFTSNTFDMPYGIRRLFLDLWFTLVDQLVVDRVFFDKSLGDGSVYYFEDQLAGGTCRAALDVALELRDRRVQQFDETFRRLLQEKLDLCPDLRVPAEAYFVRYREKTGASFWDRKTVIRMALVSGWVDEGLWGLSSRSHYDAQGVLPILAARLEDQAANGEIIFDRSFCADIERECPGLLDPDRLERRVVKLKGIGSWQVYALPPDVDPFK
jgi:class 3 adenylate cyclase